MKCYLLADVVVEDSGRFAEYLEKVPAVVAQYGGRYVVRGGAVHSLEGDLGFKRVVLFEFASREAAQRFYDSEEYRPLRQLRMETARSKVALVDAIGSDYLMGEDGDIGNAVHKSRLFE